MPERKRNNKPEKQRLTKKKDFPVEYKIIGGLAGASILILTGKAIIDSKTDGITTNQPPDIILVQEEDVQNETEKILKEFYPELAAYQTEEYKKYEVENTDFTFLNFSKNYSINSEILQDTIEGLAEFINNHEINQTINIAGKQGSWAARFFPSENKYFVIARDDMPKQQWTRGSIAVTNRPDYVNSFTFMVATGNETDILSERSELDEINLSINVELCQQIIQIGTPGNNEFTHGAQEIICNSIGRAMTLKQVGLSYSEYQQQISKYGMILGNIVVNYYVLTEEEYSLLSPNRILIPTN